MLLMSPHYVYLSIVLAHFQEVFHRRMLWCSGRQMYGDSVHTLISTYRDNWFSSLRGGCWKQLKIIIPAAVFSFTLLCRPIPNVKIVTPEFEVSKRLAWRLRHPQSQKRGTLCRNQTEGDMPLAFWMESISHWRTCSDHKWLFQIDKSAAVASKSSSLFTYM